MEDIIEEFNKAVDAIDKAFGKGYAKLNPELITALLKTAQDDFRTCCWASVIEESVDKLVVALDDPTIKDAADKLLGEVLASRPNSD